MRKAYVFEITDSIDECIESIEGQLNIIEQELTEYKEVIKIALDAISKECKNLRIDASHLRTHAIGSKAGR